MSVIYMPYTYIIMKNRAGRFLHFVYNDQSKKIVKAPAPALLYQDALGYLRTLLTGGWEEVERGAWKGVNLDVYEEALRKVHEEKLQE